MQFEPVSTESKKDKTEQMISEKEKKMVTKFEEILD
jgi:hypothetical protein